MIADRPRRKDEFTRSMGTAATLLSHHARWGYERPVAPGSGNVTFPIWLGPFRRTVPYHNPLVTPTDQSLAPCGERGLTPDLEDPRKHLFPERTYTSQQLGIVEMRVAALVTRPIFAMWSELVEPLPGCEVVVTVVSWMFNWNI